VYGDFSCPWSYLAFRRARVLVATGVEIDWRAVEHDPACSRHSVDRASRFDGLRFDALHAEMDRVVALLLPGEELPYDLAGFVPDTRAAISAYTEARIAGVGWPVAEALFESFWMHGIDIGRSSVLRTILADRLRASASPSEAVREWGYPTDVTGGPISTAAWRLGVGWSSEWAEDEKGVVPMLVLPDGAILRGVDAVEWLGRQVLDAGPVRAVSHSGARPEPSGRSERAGELPDLGWVTANGGSWLGRYREAASAR
jgi:hypothetical protein